MPDFKKLLEAVDPSLFKPALEDELKDRPEMEEERVEITRFQRTPGHREGDFVMHTHWPSGEFSIDLDSETIVSGTFEDDEGAAVLVSRSKDPRKVASALALILLQVGDTNEGVV